MAETCGTIKSPTDTNPLIERALAFRETKLADEPLDPYLGRIKISSKDKIDVEDAGRKAVEKMRRAIRSFERADTELRRAENASEQPRLSKAGTAYQCAKWNLFKAIR